MIRIDIDKSLLLNALESAIASLRRQTAKAHINSLIKDIVEKDISRYQNAINTLEEVKK